MKVLVPAIALVVLACRIEQEPICATIANDTTTVVTTPAVANVLQVTVRDR